MRKNNKNEKRKKFMKRLKKIESVQEKNESTNNLPDEEKSNKTIRLQEEPSKIAERILMKEQTGRIGKKDIEDESR